MLNQYIIQRLHFWRIYKMEDIFIDMHDIEWLEMTPKLQRLGKWRSTYSFWQSPWTQVVLMT